MCIGNLRIADLPPTPLCPPDLLNSPRGVQMSQLLASPALGSKQAQELDPSDRVTVSDAMAAFHARY